MHLTGITPALSATAREATTRARDVARQHGLTISLDLNLRRRLWTDADAAPVLRALVAGVDVVFGSPDELAVLVDADPDDDPSQLASGVTAFGPTTVVAKLGTGGAIGVETGGSAVRIEALPVATVVDPVGAGDAFCAGFIAGRLDGVDLETALRMGNACGALAVSASRGSGGLAGPRGAGSAARGPRARRASLNISIPGPDGGTNRATDLRWDGAAGERIQAE